MNWPYCVHQVKGIKYSIQCGDEFLFLLFQCKTSVVAKQIAWNAEKDVCN